jgi:hypothetical protein
MSDTLKGLDAWIEGRHITDDPRSPWYTGPEFDRMQCTDCGENFTTEDGDRCPACGSDAMSLIEDEDEPDPDRFRDDADPFEDRYAY